MNSNNRNRHLKIRHCGPRRGRSKLISAPSSRGLFISFEGIDGCGKSTQARLFYERLKTDDWPVILTKEPGGTPIGQKIRQLLLDPRLALEPPVEIFLFSADRHQHVLTVIKPALAAGQVVVCDRYTDSTTAYQVGGHGLSRGLVAGLNRLSSTGLVPDLTFFFDLPVELCRKRLGREKDRFHDQGKIFQQKVQKEYRRLAKAQRRRLVVIRETGDIKKVAAAVNKSWQRFLEAQA